MILRTPTGPLYFDVIGQGPPLAFVSGWALSSECWRPVVAFLEARYRCLIYDARGVARSQPATAHARFSVEDQAEDLHSILEAAGMFDATLVGHEMGSLVAAICADRHPQDMRAMVMVSPRAGLSENELKRLAVFAPASIALRELAAFPFIRTVVARRFRRAPQPYRDRLFDDFADLNPRAAYEGALSASMPESSARLERLVERSLAQSLIICGEKDRKGVTQARRLFSIARAARLATMRDCGFLPMLEYPRQFAKLLDRFLAASHGERRALIRR